MNITASESAESGLKVLRGLLEVGLKVLLALKELGLRKKRPMREIPLNDLLRNHKAFGNEPKPKGNQWLSLGSSRLESREDESRTSNSEMMPCICSGCSRFRTRTSSPTPKQRLFEACKTCLPLAVQGSLNPSYYALSGVDGVDNMMTLLILGAPQGGRENLSRSHLAPNGHDLTTTLSSGSGKNSLNLSTPLQGRSRLPQRVERFGLTQSHPGTPGGHPSGAAEPAPCDPEQRERLDPHGWNQSGPWWFWMPNYPTTVEFKKRAGTRCWPQWSECKHERL